MPRAFSLAGFEVTLIGRFWVTTEVKNCSSEKTTRSAQAAPWLFSTLRDNTDQSLSAVRYHFKGKHPDQKGIHDHDVKAMRVSPRTEDGDESQIESSPATDRCFVVGRTFPARPSRPRKV